MILFVLAAGGLALVVAFVRYGRTILRWGLAATLVTAGLFLWLALGHYVPIVGYGGYMLPFFLAAWFLRRRLARRIPVLAHLLARFPRHHQKELERAFKDETNQEGKRVIPKVTGWERFNDGMGEVQ